MRENLTNEDSETEQSLCSDGGTTTEPPSASMSLMKMVKQQTSGPIKDVVLNLVSMRDVRKQSYKNIFGLDPKKSERMDMLINKKEYDKEDWFNKNIEMASQNLEIEKTKLMQFKKEH